MKSNKHLGQISVIKEETNLTDRNHTESNGEIYPNQMALNMDSAEQYGSRTKRSKIQGPVLQSSNLQMRSKSGTRLGPIRGYHEDQLREFDDQSMRMP